MLTTGVTYEVRHKELEPLTVAAIRMRAPYAECGQGFGRIWNALGRHLRGKPFCLHHSPPHPDGTGDYDTCIPVRGEVPCPEGIVIKTIHGGPCVYVTHYGPYDDIGKAYDALSDYINEHELLIAGAPREVYMKGPRPIIPRNPKHFVTEIQFPVTGS